MNLDKLREKLIAAARANPPGDQVPYAFEKRILARLREQPATDPWTLWARGLWRAVVPCAALMVVLGAWSVLSSNGTASGDVAPDLEHVVLAPVDEVSDFD